MTNTIKKIAICGLFLGLGFATVATVVSSESNFLNAAGDFNGNHYAKRDATFTQSGCNEYWIDCTTHEVFLSRPAGYTDPDPDNIPQATVVLDDTDTTGRYIPAFSEVEVPTESQIEETTVVKPAGSNTPIVQDENGNNTGLIVQDSTQQSGGLEVVGYEGSSTTIVIPEGVTTMLAWKNIFNAGQNENMDKIETIVIPSTVAELEVGIFKNMPNLTTLIIKANKVNYGIVDNCPKLKTVYLFNTVNTMEAQAFYTYSGTSDRDANHLQIYCQDTANKKGWKDHWNYYGNSGSDILRFETHYGASF
ncbi:MAG: leucine-rich repeat protein [Bacilli bacterium]|nr:leucine-rich repeat protein [Bacilli bacterium]